MDTGAGRAHGRVSDDPAPGRPAGARSSLGIDVAALKRRHPIAGVVAGYGIALRRSGKSLLARCPFHADGGRPNLVLFPTTDSFFCFRCHVGGDAITFVRRIAGAGFLDAVAILERSAGTRRAFGRRDGVGFRSPPASGAAPEAPSGGAGARGRRRSPAAHPAERDCVEAAAELYHNRLLTDPVALGYVRARGIDRRTVLSCRIGYAAGGALAGYLRWRGLPLAAARRAGLIRPQRQGAPGRAGGRPGAPRWTPDLADRAPGRLRGRGAQVPRAARATAPARLGGRLRRRRRPRRAGRRSDRGSGRAARLRAARARRGVRHGRRGRLARAPRLGRSGHRAGRHPRAGGPARGPAPLRARLPRPRRRRGRSRRHGRPAGGAGRARGGRLPPPPARRQGRRRPRPPVGRAAPLPPRPPAGRHRWS